ncbi:MAG: Lrp/AsnC family transcriptional regulator [Thermoplasmata archaeon]|nr:MAG: Lrp/AsnC family transcriptional regulator [Thermoplasmata archaeon]
MPKKTKTGRSKKSRTAKKTKKEGQKDKRKATIQIFSGLLGHIPVDETDVKLIQLLQENARMTNIELAEKLNTSEATVRRRTNNLVDRGYIRAFSALLDFNRIGNPVKANIVMNVSKEKLAQVADYLSKFENVHMVSQTMGNHNLFCETFFNNILELQDFTERLAKNESVKDLDCYIITKSIKPCPWSGI